MSSFSKNVNHYCGITHCSIIFGMKISPKHAIGMYPFQFLYGLDAEISITMELPALNLAKVIEDETFEKPMEKCIMYLVELEESVFIW
jgi:hypothetical protein